jgi:polyisoprenoid-binding protein YceI
MSRKSALPRIGRKSGWTTMVLVAGLALPAPAGAAESPPAPYAIDAGRSLFAVLTHKAGIGSALAHDHLVVAPRPEVELRFDPGRPEATSFRFTVAAEALEIDAPPARAAWKGRFRELGVHSGELPPVSESDRKKVRTAMLGASQLDAAQFPEIRAEVAGLVRRGADPAAGWNVPLRLTIRGRTVERQLPATWSAADGELKAEVVGEFRWSEFGIEPYSTMLGAIRNDELFHLFVSVVARRAP